MSEQIFFRSHFQIVWLCGLTLVASGLTLGLTQASLTLVASLYAQTATHMVTIAI